MKLRTWFCAVLLGMAMIAATHAQAQSSRIVFATDRTTSSDLDIWKMREDGTYPVEMTDESGSTHSPTISPGGQKLLFDNRGLDGNGYQVSGGLYIMPQAGGTPVNLHSETVGCDASDDNDCFDFDVDAGPFANVAHDFRIVFSRQRPKDFTNYSPDPIITDIYMGTVDVSENEVVDVIAITSVGPTDLFQLDPAWCGSNHVVWSRMGGGNAYQTKICIQEVDENGPVNSPVCYAADNEFDRRPSCNGDGTQLAWDRSNGYGSSRDIWVMNCDGTDCDYDNKVNLMNDEGHALDDSHPVWSPGGAQIAFTSDRAQTDDPEDIDLDIWVMDAEDGEHKVNRTDPYPRQDIDPDWGGSSLGQ